MITTGRRDILATGRGTAAIVTFRQPWSGPEPRRWRRWPQVQVPAVPAAPRSGLGYCRANAQGPLPAPHPARAGEPPPVRLAADRVQPL